MESENSNEASATPAAPTDPEPSGNNAILEITMVTGEIKEYDLPAAELQSFLKYLNLSYYYSIKHYQTSDKMFKNLKQIVSLVFVFTFIMGSFAIIHADVEPNDSTSQAEYISVGSTKSGTVSASDAFDTYCTTGTGSNRAILITFTAIPNSNGQECQMWVYDSNKQLIKDNAKSFTIPPYSYDKFYFQIPCAVSPGLKNEYKISVSYI